MGLHVGVVGVDVERRVVVSEAAVDEVSITNATEGKVAGSGRGGLGGITDPAFEFIVTVVRAQIGRLISDVVSVKFGG